jgi:DASH complex subunit SPC19
LREAQQSLLNEITPSIAHLLKLSSNHVEKLARREQGLKARCDLQEGRLSSKSESRPSAPRAQTQSSALRGRMAGPGSSGSAASKAAELKRLVQKKERLKFAVDRLELQSQQKQRQLRKSMAAQ